MHAKLDNIKESLWRSNFSRCSTTYFKFKTLHEPIHKMEDLLFHLKNIKMNKMQYMTLYYRKIEIVSSRETEAWPTKLPFVVPPILARYWLRTNVDWYRYQKDKKKRLYLRRSPLMCTISSWKKHICFGEEFASKLNQLQKLD